MNKDIETVPYFCLLCKYTSIYFISQSIDICRSSDIAVNNEYPEDGMIAQWVGHRWLA